MDNYPNDLAPDFTETGAVATAFEEWWPTVRHAFPHVPTNVARYWLHEHWGCSPFGWLPSANYRFRLIRWPAPDLRLIRSESCDFDPNNQECHEHGDYLINSNELGGKYPTAIYMDQHGDFPTPIIVLDNRDGHLEHEAGSMSMCRDIPHAYILIEGHRRFDMALYLESVGRFVCETSIWLMERPSGCFP